MTSSSSPVGGPEFRSLRSAVYRLLLSALDKPTPEQHRHLLGAPFHEDLALVCGQFDVPLPGGALVPAEYPDFESRYLATFEVGLPEAPVVLLASHHVQHEPAPRVVHEHILFYRHFGCSPTEETGEAPDHLLNELRFLVHLDQLQERSPFSIESVERARRDFLDRQMLRWAPLAARRATERGIAGFYQALLNLLTRVLREDRVLLDGEDHLEVQPRLS
jgi:DMSO reductase family type II enzyme chaperone